MKTKLLTSLLIVTVLVCALAFAASAATVTISTPEELLTLMNEGYTMSDTFELAGDIDLSQTEGQTPIGTSGKKFTGTFDGKGYTIKGINITSSTDASYPFVGFFGLCQKATIKNLTVSGTVTGPENSSKDVYTGGLIAWARGITIDNCHSYITVVNNDSGACGGGILGYADFNGTNIEVKITNTTNRGDVTAAQYTGGILGLVQSVDKANQFLSITGCENHGNITVTTGNCVGGIVGYYRCGSTTTTGSKFTVSECSNYGAIANNGTATSKGGFIGGIVGAVLASGADGDYNTSITLTELYNNGTVSRKRSDASIGAIVGYLTLPVVAEDGTVAVTISDWVNTKANANLIYSIGNAGVPVNIGMTNIVNNASAKVFSVDKDLSESFVVGTNNTITVTGYVTSASTAAEKAAFAAANPGKYVVVDGDVTMLSTVELDTSIDSPAELMRLMYVRGDAAALDKDYKLSRNINLTGYAGQQPIGGSGTNNRFTGSFDGQGYAISGLDIEFTEMGAGLFGTTDGAVIKNLTVKGKVTSSNSRAAGLVGQAMGNLTVTNCHVDVTLKATSGASGGILGAYNAATNGTIEITGSTVKGTLTGSRYMGGIVGFLTGDNKCDLIISDCKNYASVTTTTGNVAGGVLGYWAATGKNGAGSISITYTANYGTVTAGSEVEKGQFPGGIIGAIGGDKDDSCHIATVTLTNLHNEGEIKGYSGRGDVISLIRPSNGTVYTITDIYGGSPSVVPVINQVRKDTTDAVSTYTITRAYGEGNEKIVYTDLASGITLNDCHGKLASQTGIRTLYNFTVENDTWVMTYGGPRLKKFAASADIVDYSIDSAEDIVNLMNAPYAWGGGSFTLTNNISLAGKAQSPIGTGDNFKFMADFDGKGYTISGVNIDYAAQGAGLFGTVQYGSIKNLTVKGTVNGQDSRAGGLVGAVRAPFTIENVTTEVTVSSKNGAAGGIVGAYALYDRNQTLTITGCTSNSTVNSNAYIGGILGYVVQGSNVPQNLVITDCTNNGAISGTAYGNGGILGATVFSADCTLTVSGCTNNGAVEGTKYVGGIVGYIHNFYAGTSASITNSANYGDITVLETNCGAGILGYYHLTTDSERTETTTETSTLYIAHCANYGDIEGTSDSLYLGGILGGIPSHEADTYIVDATVTDVYNAGSISGKTAYCGAIVGLIAPLKSGSYTFNNWNDTSE